MTSRISTPGGCGRFEQLTLQVAEGDALGPEDLQFLREHEGTCATCGALARAGRAVAAPDEAWGGLDELTARRLLRAVAEAPPRPAVAPTAAGAPARTGGHRRREASRWAVAAASAAAVLLVGGVALTASFSGRGPQPARSALVAVLAWPAPVIAPAGVALAQLSGPVRALEARPVAPEPAVPAVRPAPVPAADRAIVQQAEIVMHRAEAARRQAQRRAVEAERSERLARLEAERAKLRLEQLLAKEREEIARQRARRTRIILDLPGS